MKGKVITWEQLKWSQLSINRRYLINIIIIFLMMVLSVAFSTISLLQTGEAVRQVGDAGQQVARITEIGSLFRQKDTRVVDYLLRPGDASIKKYTVDQHVLTLAEKKMQPDMRTARQKQLLMQIMRNDSIAYNLFQNEFAPAVLMNDQKQALALRQQQNALQQDTMNKLSQLRQTVLTKQSEAISNANAQIRIALGSIALSLLLAIVISSIVTRRIQRSIKRSMQDVLEMTGKMASGDLRLSIHKMSAHDEIGQIGDSVIRLNHHLKEMTQAIGLLTGAARKNSQSLAQSVEIVTGNNAQVEQTLKELSSGISIQAGQTAEIADKTISFMKKIESEASKAKITNEWTQQAISTAEKGQQAMNDSVVSMADIRKSMQHCAEKMKKLKQHVTKVSEITESINSLAGQTNLLALNATIEAARSGDGKNGFSVIAASIRQLSNETSEMVGQIGQIVTGIHSETQAVEQALAASKEAADRGEDKILVTGSQFDTIQKQMLQTGNNMTALSNELHQTSLFGTDIRQSIGGFAAVFEQAASSIGEISQAIEEINRTITDFSSEASSMQDKSGRLERLVSQFKFS